MVGDGGTGCFGGFVVVVVGGGTGCVVGRVVVGGTGGAGAGGDACGTGGGACVTAAGAFGGGGAGVNVIEHPAPAFAHIAFTAASRF